MRSQLFVQLFGAGELLLQRQDLLLLHLDGCFVLEGRNFRAQPGVVPLQRQRLVTQLLHRDVLSLKLFRVFTFHVADNTQLFFHQLVRSFCGFTLLKPRTGSRKKWNNWALAKANTSARPSRWSS